MNWILNFVWVLIVEYIQNIPIIAGVVAGLSSMRRGQAWWKWSLMFLGGCFTCAVAISSTERIKVIATTREIIQPDLLSLLYMGALFSLACVFLVVYFNLASRLRKPYLADAIFGLLLGAVTAIAQVRTLAPFLVALHALGFAVVGGSMVTLLRRSAEAAPGKSMWIWIGSLTLAMSVLIVIFDYVPFLRR